MAYISRGQDEEREEGELEEGNALTGSIPRPGPTGTSGTSSAPAPEAAPSAGVPGSDFVSFDQYYSANADAAKNSANQLTSAASKTAQDATGAIDKATGDFENAVAGGSKPTQPNYFPASSQQGTEGQQPGYSAELGTLTPRMKRGGSTPNANINILNERPEDMPAGYVSPDEAQRRASSGYTGPGSLLDAQFGGQKIVDDVTHANQQVASLQTPESLQAAMHGAGSGGASDGLDAALVGRAGGQDFRMLKDKYGSLTKLLDDRRKYTEGVAGQAKAKAGQEAGRYQKALEGYEGKKAADAKVEEARSSGEWPPRTPEAAEAMIAAVGAMGGPLGIAAAAAMRAAIEAEKARERDVIAHPENYQADSTAVIGGRH